MVGIATPVNRNIITMGKKNNSSSSHGKWRMKYVNLYLNTKWPNEGWKLWKNMSNLSHAWLWLCELHGALGEPLCITALWKRPWLPGESRWKPTDAAPALSPNIVTWKQQKNKLKIYNNTYVILTSCFKKDKGTQHLTFEGSPPNAAILLATHLRAKRWSSRPMFPGKFLLLGRVRKPKAPNLSVIMNRWKML